MDETIVLRELAKEMMLICKEKGLSKDETFILGAMANDVETVKKFGEEKALRMAIEIIKLCDDDSNMIFYAVERVLGIRDN